MSNSNKLSPFGDYNIMDQISVNLSKLDPIVISIKGKAGGCLL